MTAIGNPPIVNSRGIPLFGIVFAVVLLLIMLKAALDGDWHAVRAFGFLLLVFVPVLLLIYWMNQHRGEPRVRYIALGILVLVVGSLLVLQLAR